MISRQTTIQLNKQPAAIGADCIVANVWSLSSLNERGEHNTSRVLEEGYLD